MPRPTVAVVGVALTALVTTGVAALVVAATWRPSPDGGETAVSVRIVDAAGTIGLLSTVAAAILLVRSLPPGERRGVTVLAGVAGVASVLGRFAAPLPRWDQLALWSVDGDTDLRGYWFAAFDDRVRFVLVDGFELGQPTFRVSALVATTAPWVAVALLASAVVVAVRDRGPVLLDRSGSSPFAPEAQR